ncbi:MAG: MerC domain-containing protein [Saprospiraceae bacterium]|nr:MAG: MerC mercury resistance protein [Bacteroidetes bacterium OLB9]MCO6463107.1 MerC domain-containing protein [Saprospiraceae bacterium]MCZ2338840.1 MerC domain-containing protein [Chitinophagales bacterium]
MKSFLNINPDAAGFFTSMLCAVHCSAVPVLISMGLLGSGSWLHNHAFDWIIIGIGVLIASYSLIGDFYKKHKNILPLAMAMLGFAMLIIGMIEHHGWMLGFSVVGGIIVALAHMYNHKLGANCCTTP